jgi:hypothetical protein
MSGAIEATMGPAVLPTGLFRLLYDENHRTPPVYRAPEPRATAINAPTGLGIEGFRGRSPRAETAGLAEAFHAAYLLLEGMYQLVRERASGSDSPGDRLEALIAELVPPLAQLDHLLSGPLVHTPFADDVRLRLPIAFASHDPAHPSLAVLGYVLAEHLRIHREPLPADPGELAAALRWCLHGIGGLGAVLFELGGAAWGLAAEPDCPEAGERARAVAHSVWQARETERRLALLSEIESEMRHQAEAWDHLTLDEGS